MILISFNLSDKIGATTSDLPPGVLYRVKATYKYVKEDVDELSFDVGETIEVIEYDDPEDQVSLLYYLTKFVFSIINEIFLILFFIQEEGWLMGQKENSTEKGLFPANFTRPL